MTTMTLDEAIEEFHGSTMKLGSRKQIAWDVIYRHLAEREAKGKVQEYQYRDCEKCDGAGGTGRLYGGNSWEPTEPCVKCKGKGKLGRATPQAASSPEIPDGSVIQAWKNPKNGTLFGPMPACHTEGLIPLFAAQSQSPTTEDSSVVAQANAEQTGEVVAWAPKAPAHMLVEHLRSHHADAAYGASEGSNSQRFHSLAVDLIDQMSAALAAQPHASTGEAQRHAVPDGWRIVAEVVDHRACMLLDVPRGTKLYAVAPEVPRG
jgi:hypothetical protein